jgi:hypothetical protein
MTSDLKKLTLFQTGYPRRSLASSRMEEVMSIAVWIKNDTDKKIVEEFECLSCQELVRKEIINLNVQYAKEQAKLEGGHPFERRGLVLTLD